MGNRNLKGYSDFQLFFSEEKIVLSFHQIKKRISECTCVTNHEIIIF